MRIALIAPPWIPVPPENYGGTERVVAELATGFANRGHDVTLFAHPESRLPSSIRVVQPLGIRPGDQDESAGEYEAGWLPAALEYVERSDPPFDIVHDHTSTGKLVKPHGLPYLTTLHWLTNDITQATLRTAAQNASIVAISESQARLARERGVRVDAVIHHGVPLDATPMGDGAGDYFLWVGRMYPAKGGDIAARVASQSGLRLVMAAPIRVDKERAFFERYVQPHLGSHVQFVGEQSHDEILRLMRGAKAMVYPLRWQEPLGMALIEGLASGTPLVVSGEGSSAEIVDGRSGIIAPNESDLAAAWLAATRLSRQDARDRAEREFSTDLMVERHLALYQTLIRAHALMPSRDQAQVAASRRLHIGGSASGGFRPVHQLLRVVPSQRALQDGVAAAARLDRARIEWLHGDAARELLAKVDRVIEEIGRRRADETDQVAHTAEFERGVVDPLIRARTWVGLAAVREGTLNESAALHREERAYGRAMSTAGWSVFNFHPEVTMTNPGAGPMVSHFSAWIKQVCPALARISTDELQLVGRRGDPLTSASGALRVVHATDGRQDDEAAIARTLRWVEARLEMRDELTAAGLDLGDWDDLAVMTGSAHRVAAPESGHVMAI